MSHVLHASVVDSLMHAMDCNRPNIAHAVGVVGLLRGGIGVNQ
jgi:hypothetical protein